MMKLEAWSPAFKPNKASPIVPLWVVIPELPWLLYYMEILTSLLSLIGKALYLYLASFQKTRGSVAKVKAQIDITKERPHHVWLEYDDNQDKNSDGELLEVQYDNVPTYCIHCRHLGHSEYSCDVRIIEEERKKRKEEEAKEIRTKNNGDKPNQNRRTTCCTKNTCTRSKEKQSRGMTKKMESRKQATRKIK